MKKSIVVRRARRPAILLLALGAMSGCAAGRGWSHANTALEIGFAGELAIDTYQTATYILPNCTETNPIVGRCGDRVPLAAYVPLTLVLHAVIAWALPPRARDMFQAASVGAEGLAIGTNWRTQRDRPTARKE